MTTRDKSGTNRRNALMHPRWGLLAVIYTVTALVGLGVLRMIGLSWSAIAGCALVLAVGIPVYMWRWKKGLDEWNAED